MRFTYDVPCGHMFLVVTTIREAKRMARENGDGSQWFRRSDGVRFRCLYDMHRRRWLWRS